MLSRSVKEAGTMVKLPDGRVGTVVFNGLCGVGIKWGEHEIPDGLMDGTVGDLARLGIRGKELAAEWQPEALLRDPWPGADLECVGTDYEILDAD